MTRILAFTSGPEDWQALLADPVKHWRSGYSARTLAYCREAADGFPLEVAQASRQTADPLLANLIQVLAVPEFKAPLPGGLRASQNDIFVLACSSAGPMSIMVEGKVIEALEPKYRALLQIAPVKFASLPRSMPPRGIYLFSEGDRHLYVGRTNSIRERLQGHCRPSGTHFTATFAFRIARQDTGRLNATYATSGSRAELVKDPIFGPAFDQAKQRVAAMDIRYVEETDPVRQAVLEIYVALVLGTPYNDFDNH
ncbi:MAG: hypothetical protein M1343_10115 [Chloroflexi bacterium]|nr:hypothetical protein [Chloroflexota bacterium]